MATLILSLLDNELPVFNYSEYAKELCLVGPRHSYIGTDHYRTIINIIESASVFFRK